MHFEDFSGSEFERLVLAYVLRASWPNPEWLGESGADQGRDIWCADEDGTATVFLCANYKELTFGKVSSDLQKLVAGGHKPDEVFVIGGGRIGSALRARIKAEAARLAFKKVSVWSGVELEERIRNEAPHLLRRFCEGEPFPDTVAEMTAFVATTGATAAGPKLSPEATKLLVAMAKAEDGEALRAETMDGYSLTIAGHDFVPDTKSGREKARWERAIEELLEQDLLRGEGANGDLLGLTDAGFSVADGLIPSVEQPTAVAAPVGFKAEVMPDPAAYFRALGDELIPETPFDGGPLSVQIPPRPATCLRLYPAAPVPRITSALAAKHLATKGDLRPMGVELDGADWIRNVKGALVYAGPQDGKLTNFTQFFVTGEICGLDLRLVRRVHQNTAAGDFMRHLLLIYHLEAGCALALRNYLRFSRQWLQHPPPLRVEASLHGIKGCQLGLGVRIAGQALEDNVVWAGAIEADQENPAKILEPFFIQVWEAFGVTRFSEAEDHLRHHLAT